MRIKTWWSQEAKQENPEPSEYNLVVTNDTGESRLATIDDLYCAGFTPQEVAKELIVAKTRKLTIEVKKLKDQQHEIVEALRTIVNTYRDCKNEGYTFEEFENPEGLDEAIESAEEILEEIDK